MARKRKHRRKTDNPTGWHLALIAPIGGLARALRQTPAERTAAATIAAQTRWSRVAPAERKAFMAHVRSHRLREGIRPHADVPLQRVGDAEAI